MTDKLENYNSIAVFGDANRVSAAGGLSTIRKRWATPQVILGTMAEAELGAGAVDDGDTDALANNS